MRKQRPKVSMRANVVTIDEWDRRVARLLSYEGWFLRHNAEAVMRAGEGWDRGSALYKEARLSYLLTVQAAILIEDLAKKTISKGLPKRERTMLLKLLAADVAANVRAAKGGRDGQAGED